MSSYICTASDSQLLGGSVGNQGPNVLNTTLYSSLKSLESFSLGRKFDQSKVIGI